MTKPIETTSDQYRAQDGGVEVLPEMAGNLIVHANANGLRPLGLVVLNEDTEYPEYLNEGVLSPLNHHFALALFRCHAHYWFCYVPSRTGHADN